MTVCLLLQAPGYPTILSDCLVTTTGQGRGFTPSDWFIYEPGRIKPAALVGKSIRLDGRSVVSFAGRQDRILKLLPDLEQNFPLFRLADPDRPMRRVAAFVEDFNSGAASADEEVSALGFTASGANGVHKVNPLLRVMQQVPTRRFGPCAAIGSGSRELLRWIDEFDRDFAFEGDEPPGNLDLVCAVGALNATKFFGQEQDPTWGGCLQATIYGIEEQAFYAAPDWAYCGFVLNLTDTGCEGGWMGKIVLVWTRGPDTFVRWQAHDGDQAMGHTWRIASGLGERPDDASTEDGGDFSARFATVVWRVFYRDKSWDRITTLNGHLMAHLKLCFADDGSIKWDLDHDYIRSVATEELAHGRERFG